MQREKFVPPTLSSHVLVYSTDSSEQKWNEMNRALGHLCADSSVQACTGGGGGGGWEGAGEGLV